MTHCTLHSVDVHSKWKQVVACYNDDFYRFHHTLQKCSRSDVEPSIERPAEYRGFLHIALEASQCTFTDIYRYMYDIDLPKPTATNTKVAEAVTSAVDATLFEVNDAIQSLIDDDLNT